MTYESTDKKARRSFPTGNVVVLERAWGVNAAWPCMRGIRRNRKLPKPLLWAHGQCVVETFETRGLKHWGIFAKRCAWLGGESVVCMSSDCVLKRGISGGTCFSTADLHCSIWNWIWLPDDCLGNSTRVSHDCMRVLNFVHMKIPRQKSWGNQLNYFIWCFRFRLTSERFALIPRLHYHHSIMIGESW